MYNYVLSANIRISTADIIIYNKRRHDFAKKICGLFRESDFNPPPCHPIGFCNNCCNKPYILFYENICQMNTYQENYGKPKLDMGEGGGFACPENTK